MRRTPRLMAGINHIPSAHDVGPEWPRTGYIRRPELALARPRDHDRDSRKSTLQPLRITHVTDEISQARMIKSRNPHVMLFEFVAAEDNQLFAGGIHAALVRRTSARKIPSHPDQYDLFRPVHRCSPQNESTSRKTKLYFRARCQIDVSLRKYSGESSDKPAGTP